MRNGRSSFNELAFNTCKDVHEIGNGGIHGSKNGYMNRTQKTDAIFIVIDIAKHTDGNG